MTVPQLAELITKYNLKEQGDCLYYNSNQIGIYGASYKGLFINFSDCTLQNVFNPIACDCKIKNMIKDFKKSTIKKELNEIEKDFN